MAERPGSISRFWVSIGLFFKEMAHFFRFFWRTPGTEKAIVFYAEHEGYYPNFEGIIEKLIAGHGLTLCYVTSDPDDPVLQETGRRIKAFYLNKLLPYFMVLVNCKAFVMTMTDLNQFHIKRSMNPVHYFYVFHSLVSTHMMYRRGAFDHYDTILCAGPHQVREIRKHEELSNLPPKRLVEAGYYRLERIRGKFKDYVPTGSSSGKSTILIAPSWGAGNVLESCGERLVDILLEAGYEVIVRPHPETVRRSHDLMSFFKNKYGDHANFTLEKSVSSDESLLRADVLICDCSGVALEYAFGTERPVLFLDVPPKIQNERFEELGIEPLELSLRPEIGVVVCPDEIPGIPAIISELISNRMTYKNQLSQLRGQHVYAFGKSSEVSADAIVSLLSSEN